MKKKPNKNENSYELTEFTREWPQQDPDASIEPLISHSLIQNNNQFEQKHTTKTASKDNNMVQQVTEKMPVVLAGNSYFPTNLPAHKLISVLSGCSLEFTEKYTIPLTFAVKLFMATEDIKIKAHLSDITLDLSFKNTCRSHNQSAKGIIITADLEYVRLKGYTFMNMSTPVPELLDWRTATLKLLTEVKEKFSEPRLPIFLIGMVSKDPFNHFSNFPDYSGFTEFVKNNQLHALSTIVNIEDKQNIEGSIDLILKEIYKLSPQKSLLSNNVNNNNNACRLM